MCGIVYYHNLRGKNVAPKVIKKYMQQRRRGSQGFGIYLPDKDRMAHNPVERKMIKHLNKLNENIIMFHHRFPTSTNNVKNACHPFSTKDFFKNNYVLIHNGVISNSKVLKEEHEKLGIKYVSEQPDGRFNDSEALLWDVALYLEKKQDELKAIGSIAFVIYQHKVGEKTTKDSKLMFARNYGSPLKIHKSETHLRISSEVEKNDPALDVLTNSLHTYSYKTHKIKIRPLTVPSWNSHAYTPYRNDDTKTKKIEAKASDEIPNWRDRTWDLESGTWVSLAESKINKWELDKETKKLEVRLKRSFKYYMNRAKGVYEVALDSIADDALAAQKEKDQDEMAYLELVFNMVADAQESSELDIDPTYETLNKMGFVGAR